MSESELAQSFRRAWLAGLVASLVLLVAGCAVSAGAGQVGSPGGRPLVQVTTGAREPASVERVVDGDTLVVVAGGDRVRVRLIGVDAPESVKPDTPVQCYGKEASEKVKQILPAGSAVMLETDPVVGDQDQYGRLLRHVFLPDGENLAVVLAGGGYAREYVYNHTPSIHASEIHDAAENARTEKVGLWGACTGQQ